MNTKLLILNKAVAEGLDVIGDRWALLILQAVFDRKGRFEEIRKSIGASRATLTRRLNALIENDILYKRQCTPSSNRYEYTFTEKGLDLFGASLLARQWERDWTEQDVSVRASDMFHTRCGNTLAPRVVCRHCRNLLKIEDVEWQSLSQDLDRQLGEIKTMNNHRRVRPSSKEYVHSARLADLIGDRWTLLILIVAFFGTTRYDEFVKQISIAPGILTTRLAMLMKEEVFERKTYQTNPPRYNYKLTAKGKSLYPFTMALRQWALDWLADENPTPNLIHKTCGHALLVDIDCKSCGQKPWIRDVQYR